MFFPAFLYAFSASDYGCLASPCAWATELSSRLSEVMKSFDVITHLFSGSRIGPRYVSAVPALSSPKTVSSLRGSLSLPKTLS